MSDASRLLTHMLDHYGHVNRYLTAIPMFNATDVMNVDFSIHLREVRYDTETRRAEFILVEEQVSREGR